MTLSCIIFKYKPYSDILDTLEPFFFSVCVNPYSQINLYFQHNSSTLLLLSHSCLHQPFRLQTQKTRARPSHQESEDSVRRGQAHLFRTQKISSKKTKQKWTNEPWGCKTETQAGHMPTCVPQQLLTDSDSALLHIRGAAAAFCLALTRLPLDCCFDSAPSSINISAVHFMLGDLSQMISAASHQRL